jgi:hypothetical protein
MALLTTQLVRTHAHQQIFNTQWLEDLPHGVIPIFWKISSAGGATRTHRQIQEKRPAAPQACACRWRSSRAWGQTLGIITGNVTNFAGRTGIHKDFLSDLVPSLCI